MDNLITVVSLQGKAWAVAQDGSRRELQVGDTVAADEMVVTAAGAQIDLQFADNQVLTLVGEQDAPVDVAQLAKEAELSQPLTPINSAKEDTSSAITVGDTLESEGHRFVQLVRIHEIIESDGFTPLTVARIQEIIKPLGMVLPERDFEDDRWKEHVSYREHGSNIQYSISIAIDVIADDDIINAAEAQRDITVTGTVGGDVKPGDKVTVTVNGKTYETTVNADGKTWNVDIPGSELVQDKTVEATVTSKTPTGDTITADTERPYEVLTELPKVDVELEGAGDDGVYNESEIVNGKVPAKITLDPNTVKEGDILKVTTPNGDVLLERPVTQDDINNGVLIDVPVAPGDKTVIVEATITNPEGNTGADRDEKPVDNITPTLKVELEGYGDDGIYNETEITNGKVPGTVTLNPETVKEGDILKVTTPNGDVLLERPVTQDDINNGVPVEVPVAPGDKTVTVEATITDPAGNSSKDSDTKPVDNLPPELIGALGPKNDADADDITLDLSKEFNDVFSGKDLTYQATDLPTGLEIDPSTGIISGKIDSSASQGDNTGTKGEYSVTITVTDPAGNSREHNFNWTVINPVPTAKNDDNRVGEDDPSVVGNVLTGEGSKNPDSSRDVDSDGDVLTVIGVEKGTPGTPPAAGVNTPIKGEYGSLTLNPDGSYTYTPDSNDPRVNALKDGETIDDVFTYTMTDGEGGTDTATLTITIDGRTDGDPTITPVDGNGPDNPDIISTIGQVTVNESGLINGSTEGSGHINTGVITIKTPDGLASIEVGGQLVDLAALLNLDPADPDTHITIDTPEGKLTLTGFDSTTAVGDVPTLGDLHYSYELEELQNTPADPADPSVGRNSTESIALKVTDAGGSTNTGNLLVNIIDDVPVAKLDTAEITEDAFENTVSGDVFANDTLGADVRANPVTGVSFDGKTGTLGTALSGDYGHLTLEADGTYSYELNNDNAAVNALKDGETLSEEFTYTITDADGDTSSTTLTITIKGKTDGDPTITPVDGNGPDNPDIISTIGQVTVNESGLINGSTEGSGHINTGVITIKTPDGLASIEVGGQLVDLAALLNLDPADPDTHITIDTPEGKLTLTDFSSTTTVGGVPTLGDVHYSYELEKVQNTPADPADPSVGRNSTENIVLKVTDAGGGTNTGNLVVNIIDDEPTVSAAGTLPSILVKEAELGKSESADFGAVFTHKFGADGGAITYELVVNSESSGLIDTTTGKPIELSLDDGVIKGMVGGTADVAFTITINANGVVELKQVRALQHGDPSKTDEQVKITNGAISLKATVTDGDGDEASASVTIGERFGFEDDGPTITIADGDLPEGLVTKDADTLTGTSTASENFAGAFVATSDYGGDGDGGTVWEYALGLKGEAISVVSGLSTGGDAINLYVVDGQIIGSTAGAAGGVTASNIAFSITVDGVGQVTLTQQLPIDHGDVDSSNETIALVKDLITLTGTATITDGDGDTDSSSQTINIGDKFVFTDDGPTVGTSVDSTVNEANLAAGSAANNAALTQAGNLNIGLSADGVDTQFVLSTVADFEALTLTSNGTNLTYVLSTDGHTLTATAGANTVFTATITNPTADSAGYEFVLSGTIDHVQPGNDTEIDLPFNFVVTDKDGDTATGSFKVTVVDDVPVAIDQAAVDVVEGASAIGYDGANWSAGTANLIGNDTQGADGATVHQIRYKDVSDVEQIATAGSTVTTQHGELTVNADGTWSYTPNASIAHTNNDPVSDLFSYNLIDADGDVSGWADQPINVTDTTPVAKDDAQQSAVEGATSLTGDVIGNDTSSADGTPTIYDFVYTDAAGDSQTHTFVAGADEVTVNTPTGDLKVNKNGQWEFTPTATFDHNGTDNAGSFTYRLVDNDGSVSNTATQPIVITDTNPTLNDVSLSIDEKDIKGLGSAGALTDNAVTANLNISKNQDDIADVVFNQSTIDQLITQSLKSGGTALSYTVSADGHTLIAKAGTETVFELQLNNTGDTSGTTQSISMTLKQPLDHASADGQNNLAINIAYQVSDIDSSVDGTLTLNVIDDVPAIPVNDTAVTVEEGAVAVGSAHMGDNLLANDVLGADGGHIYDISYTDRLGATQTNVEVPVAGLTVETQYGLLTVQQNGGWTYTPVDSADHVQPANDTALRDDFSYRVIDNDGDISAGSATQEITVTDTNPVFNNVSNSTVSEANFELGSNPDTAKLVVNGDLSVTPGKDTFDVTFAMNTVVPTGLASRGVAVEYDLSTDGYTLIAYRGTGRTEADKVFTVQINDPTDSNAGYTYTLHDVLDHGTKDELDLTFNVVVTDSDNDKDEGSFKVTVLDDEPVDAITKELDEDTDISFNTSADANPDNTTIHDLNDVPLDPQDNANGGKDYKTPQGTVTVNADGTITYTPDRNYRGEEQFKFVTTDGGVTEKTTTVTVTVNPVADAPLFSDRTDDGIVVTPEDNKAELKLELPSIKDVGGLGVEDHSELLGAITLSFTAADANKTNYGTGGFDAYKSGVKLFKGTDELTADASGNYHFVIVDGSDNPTELHIKEGLPPSTDVGVYYITQAEYEALQVLPPEDRHENFKVQVEASSYEVDGDGKALYLDGAYTSGMSAADKDKLKATSEQTITVDVQAVTDAVGLKVKADTTQDNVTVVISADGADEDKIADITFNEDTSFNLTNILAPDTFKDTDGSETRYLGLKGLPDGTIVNVAGVDYMIGQASTPTVNFGGSIGEIPTITIVGTETGLPNITITPPKDFSGDLTGVKVILGAKDSDSDSPAANPVPVMDEVTINLHVKPVAGDVAIEGTKGLEDTAIKFLENIKVTDDSTATGTLGEVITEVSFTLPDDWMRDTGKDTWSNAEGQTWTMTEPTDGAGWTGAWVGDTYTITFDTSPTGITKEARENILKEFTVTPPAHSSKDIDLRVKVTSVDHSIIDGGSSSDPASKTETLTVVVKPVAERVDSNSDGADGNDVTMGSDYVYSTPGEEDELFVLGVEGTFKLSAGWSNEDGKWVFNDGENKWEDVTSTDISGRSEDTFALLTPYMTKNNDAGHDSGNPNENLEGMLEGSVFTYIDGDGETITLPFAGEPVKIPMQYLDSVQFKGPEDWSGVVKIKVQAGTIDYDEDDNAATKLEISGESWLTNLIIEPRADQVTLKVDTPIKTLEDTPVKLNIVPTSSDKNETFDVTISGIPKGATIKYWENGTENTFTANADNSSLSITNFDKTKQPELTPPTDSNEPINLTVKAESVDTLTYINDAGHTVVIEHKGTTKTTKVYGNGINQPATSEETETVGSDTSYELPINVEVQGVPDKPSVTIVDGKVYLEDGGTDQEAATGLKVALKDLVTSMKSGEIGVEGTEANPQPDGSETITLRISDLPEGFTLTGAGPQLGAGSGTERVWVISKADLDNVQIVVPEHYSGTVKFTVQPVVTENDNPSEVFFDKQNVSFKVKPVAEASLSVSSNLTEDTIGKLNLTAVGADTNEYISAVRISAAEVTAKGLTLHAADGALLTPGADGFYTFTYNGLNSQKAPDVYVKGPANYSGDIKLNIGYTVTDPVADGTITAATKGGTVEHTLNFAPVTDKIDLSLGSVNGEAIVVGGVTTQTDPGTIKVKLNIEQKADLNADSSVNDGKDIDNSEQLTHILITGVPAGVSVKGAVETASGQWLMTIDSKKWDGDAILEHELEFVVSGYAAPFTGQTITITTYSKDTGAANYEKDSVEWKLTYNRDTKEDDNDLPEVGLDTLDGAGLEDNTFKLNTVVQGTIDPLVDNGNYNVTLTIRTKEGDDTTFVGMTSTQVVENGKTVTLWTRTEKVAANESGQDKLNTMLEEIEVKTSQDANSSDLKGANEGTDGKLKLDINLSVHADGISRDDGAQPEVVITPETDKITIGVSTNIADEDEEVALNITLPTITVDGTFIANPEPGDKGWTIVDGKVYIHVADDGTGLQGQLADADGNALTEYSGARPEGTPADGKLYAVDVDKVGGLKFVPNKNDHPHQTGKLDITVLVKNQEIGASNVVVSTGTGSVEIQQSNSGYEATITAAGAELQGKVDDKLIKLEITDQGLVDDKETIDSAFISGLPDGFTVWVGEPATMASNAGSGTWAIPLDGNDLPANISIKPPKNWAGTLEDLKFTVMSGHTGLTPTASDIRFDLVVNPVANGIEMNPTLSFGEAGDKIELNLNASMKDPSAATGAKDKEGKLTDQYTELTELSLSGFPDGQKVQFFIGDSEVPLDGSQATFDGDTWTITGLTQNDLQNLKFLHAEGSKSDIKVKGRTYEVDADGNPYQVDNETQYSDWSDEKDVSINISPTVPTSGADHFLWNDKAINGFGGEDTVQLRLGDDLGTGDFSKMKNIEIIDMSGKASGDNSITGLTPEDVFNMTDDDNLLKIIADKSDTVDLDSSWDTGATKDGKTTYSYTDPDSSIKINLEVTLID